MQSVIVSPGWLQPSLQKMPLTPFTFCISRRKVGLPGAVAVASLGASQHPSGSSAFQQRKLSSWEGTTHLYIILGTSPQGKRCCWAPRLASAHPPADQTCQDQPGRRGTSPCWQQAGPPRTIPARDLLLRLVVQLLGCKTNPRRRTMEEGALPTLPAPGVQPLLKPLLLTCSRTSPACYSMAQGSH